MSEPKWISLENALSIQKAQIEISSGVYGVRDQGLLVSALDKPRNQYFYDKSSIDFADLAASYAYGIVKNHPFGDGNKRTAVVVFNTFLYRNLAIFLTEEEEIYKNIVGLAAGEISEEDFSNWIRISLLRTISEEKLKLDK